MCKYPSLNGCFIEDIEGFLIFVVFQTQHVACHLEKTQLMFTGFNWMMIIKF